MNNGVLMSNRMSHRAGHDDKGNQSHDGRESGPMREYECVLTIPRDI